MARLTSSTNPPATDDDSTFSEEKLYRVNVPRCLNDFGRLAECLDKFNKANPKNHIKCEVHYFDKNPQSGTVYLQAPNSIEANRCISLLTHGPLQDHSLECMGKVVDLVSWEKFQTRDRTIFQLQLFQNIPPLHQHQQQQQPRQQPQRGPIVPPLPPQQFTGQLTYGGLQQFREENKGTTFAKDTALGARLLKYVHRSTIYNIFCLVFYSLIKIIDALQNSINQLLDREKVYQAEIAALKRRNVEITLDNVKLFVAAALSEGLTYTQAARFLIKLNIGVPNETSFYKAQKELYNTFLFYTVVNVERWRAQMQAQAVVAFDTAWSNVRNANFALALFIDCITQKIVDFQLCAKGNHKVLPNHITASSCMEGVLFSALASRWNDGDLSAIVHDNDAATSLKIAAMGIDDLLDPRHWWKHYHTFWASFGKKHEKEGSIEILKTSLKSFFDLLCGDPSLTQNQKVQYWLNAKRHYRGDHSNCLPSEPQDVKTDTKWTTQLSPSTLSVLDKFIDIMSFYITKVDTRFWTQMNEAIHSQKNLVADKQHGWQNSWIIRVCCTICQHNDPFVWFSNFVEWAGIGTMGTTAKYQLEEWKKNKADKAARNQKDQDSLKAARIEKKKETMMASQQVTPGDAHLSKDQARIKTAKAQTFKSVIIDGQHQQVTKVTKKLFDKLCPSLVGRSPKAAKPELPESDCTTMDIDQLRANPVSAFTFKGMLSYFTTSLMLLLHCSEIDKFVFSKLFPFNDQTKFVVYLKGLLSSRSLGASTAREPASLEIDCAPLFWVVKNRGKYGLRKGVLEPVYPALTLLISAFRDAYIAVACRYEFAANFVISGTFVIKHKVDEKGTETHPFQTHLPYVDDDHLGATIALPKRCGPVLGALPQPLSEMIRREFDVATITPDLPPTCYIDITTTTQWPAYLFLVYPLKKLNHDTPKISFDVNGNTRYRMVAMIMQEGQTQDADAHKLVIVEDLEKENVIGKRLLLEKTVAVLYTRGTF